MIKLFIRLGLIALLVYAGVTLWYGRVEKKMERTAPAETQTAQQPGGQEGESASPPPEHDVILARNIFKTGMEAVETGGVGVGTGDRGEESTTEDLAETRMQLVLLGTVTGSREDARAIIRDQGTKLEEIYRIGSELNGASIVRISRGRVVLRVNGREEVLTLKSPESTTAGRQASTLPGRQAAAQMDMDDGQKVPEAIPRRRINFRNPAPETQAPVPVPQGNEIQPPQPDQAVQGEVAPPVPPEPEPATPPPEGAEAGGTNEAPPPQ